ncbi:hypothetical protein TVAG_270540 [Trichomonas vaginalis G3]|uniref:Transmembrane protein n=1 Tax=Trichomonas vaginalis (strain ATCC PRA-98 / G3) TaxID=412133 RepID=A2FG04_TRIV3|nr:hypothetical protein TVAGG3_0781780 [Trichomonas vaginalis G3]EAX96166.1 hypothetical protein TVAG_270540 [Trichomonas vaginalis G3]KAI5495103.1 hypothetical protein TVAGG3_0781780 [Trichomonas vaginalis G3]|eukprot:XP_001309096.1 hypothetical protein [Trichomonas vaginalis G3]
MLILIALFGLISVVSAFTRLTYTSEFLKIAHKTIKVLISLLNTNKDFTLIHLKLFNSLKLNTVTIQYAQVLERFSVNQIETGINIFDTTFMSCQASNDPNNANGGGIYVNSLHIPYSTLTMRHVCFHNCHAAGSGGCTYVLVNILLQSYVLAKNSYALSNQAFSLYSTFGSINYTTACECGIQPSKYEVQNTVGIGGGFSSFNLNNISNNKFDGPSCIINIYCQDGFNASECIFSKNEGISGISCDNINRKIFIFDSYIYQNHFQNGTTICSKCPTIFDRCWIEVYEDEIVDHNTEELVMFLSCIFNAKEEEVGKFIKSSQLINCKFNSHNLPVIFYIPRKCWDRIDDAKPAQKVNKIKLRHYLLSFFAFVTGACIVSIVQFILVNKRAKERRIRVFRQVV